jgi:hypothetical protein
MAFMRVKLIIVVLLTSWGESWSSVADRTRGPPRAQRDLDAPSSSSPRPPP